MISKFQWRYQKMTLAVLAKFNFGLVLAIFALFFDALQRFWPLDAIKDVRYDAHKYMYI